MKVVFLVELEDNSSHSMRYKEYLQLARLSRIRKRSPEAYFRFQQFQGELLASFLESQGIPLHDRLLLDLGCGLGGYGDMLRRHGARVIALDLKRGILSGAIPLVHADALSAPFQSKAFDMILCASLIEHVPDPGRLLEEIARLLRTGGIAYLSYPPFYSPLGGHHFSPFHLLGEKAALYIAHKRRRHARTTCKADEASAYPCSYRQAFGDWGLYRRTIAQVEDLLSELPFDLIKRSTRWLPIDFSGIPILREFLTWHVQFILRRR